MKRGEVLELIEIPFDGQVFIVPQAWGYKAIIEKYGYWEPAVAACVIDALTPETVFVDAGAQIGHYTLLAAKRAKEVFAFEPRADMREVLRANVERNGYRNVTVSDYALYSRETEGFIGRDLDDGTDMQWAMFREGTPTGDFKAARTTTLDAYLGGRRADVMKIDIEGAEIDALMGMEETIGRHAPTLIIELHPMVRYYDRQASDLARLFERWGYRWRGVADFGEGRGLDWGFENARHIVAWKGENGRIPR